MEEEGDGFLFSKGHTCTPEHVIPQTLGIGKLVSHRLPPGPVDRDEKASDLVRAKGHLPSTKQTLRVPPGPRPKDRKPSAPCSSLIPWQSWFICPSIALYLLLLSRAETLSPVVKAWLGPDE